MSKKLALRMCRLTLALLLCASFAPSFGAIAQADDASPPAQPVKLVFIHHSTGENWLSDGYGDLGLALAQNNYFVSDTNYGWGPDSIGDATDIPNWVDWFRSERTPTYMEALFNENEQHSSYTRTFDDPGGENSIVLFKSCFPNSDLEGRPTDPPDPDGWLSVGHAKWVYNEILQYFATRPDKLFVVITAPPLSDGAHAANARALNTWLMYEWLEENHYTQENVAVFDFYNILTGPDGRHTFADGRVLYVTGERGTLYYPSDDDHPSIKGSQRATAEFVPLLNFFYNRWRASAPAQPPEVSPPEPAATNDTGPVAARPGTAPALGEIDSFEAASALSQAGWQAYHDEATATTITCAPSSATAHSGRRALQIEFNVAANSWATCSLSFDTAQDWRSAEGLSFYLNAGQAGLLFNVDILAGDPENPGTYAYTVEAPPESAGGWIPVSLRWEDFHRVEWEENGGAPLAEPAAVRGMAFGFNTLPEAPNTGVLWVDDLALSSGAALAPEVVPATQAVQEAVEMQPVGEAPASEPVGRGLPCGSAALPLLAAAAVWAGHRKVKSL